MDEPGVLKIGAETVSERAMVISNDTAGLVMHDGPTPTVLLEAGVELTFENTGKAVQGWSSKRPGIRFDTAVLDFDPSTPMGVVRALLLGLQVHGVERVAFVAARSDGSRAAVVQPLRPPPEKGTVRVQVERRGVTIDRLEAFDRVGRRDLDCTGGDCMSAESLPAGELGRILLRARTGGSIDRVEVLAHSELPWGTVLALLNAIGTDPRGGHGGDWFSTVQLAGIWFPSQTHQDILSNAPRMQRPTVNEGD